MLSISRGTDWVIVLGSTVPGRSSRRKETRSVSSIAATSMSVPFANETVTIDCPDRELEEIYFLINRLLRTHLTDNEYHRLFLKEDHPE